MTDLRSVLVLVLVFGGCAHLAQTEAQHASEQASAANTARFDAALASAVRETEATLLPEPSQWFQPGGACSLSSRAAPDKTPLPVVLAGSGVTVDCDALLAAMRAGDPIEAADGSGSEVTLVFAPLGSSFLGTTKDGAFVHFKPQPQVITRRMTIVTPGLSCCCDAPDEGSRQPQPFWVLPGSGLAIRSVSVPFEFERVELKCDPRAPQ